MERAEHAVDAGAFAQFGQQRAGCVLVGLVGIGRIGPHRVVNDLGSLFQVHVQRGFQYVDMFLQLFVAGLADLGLRVLAVMMIGQRAGRVGGFFVLNLAMHFLQLRLELAQELFAFLFKR